MRALTLVDLFAALPHTHTQSMWEVQRKVPAVSLYGPVTLCYNDFLIKKIPSIGKLLDRKVADYQSVQKDFLARKDASIAS
jgi:hypothetical protein